MENIKIKNISLADQAWIKKVFQENWSSNKVVCQGKTYMYKNLQGFVAFLQGKRVGLLTYTKHEEVVKIITLNSTVKNVGIGSKLLNYLIDFFENKNVNSIEVATTNDNTEALRLYQMKGFAIKKVNLNIMKAYRKIKPELPIKGNNEIEIRDEFVLEKRVSE